jgi:hypothetical protein
MAFDKSVFEPNELSIHFKLFKLFHIFHLFNPKCKKLWNFNVYHLAWYTINCVICCTITFGWMGYFTEKEDVFNIINDIQIMFCSISYYLCLVKWITFVYKANDTWNLLNVTRIIYILTKKKNTKIVYHMLVCYHLSLYIGTFLYLTVMLNVFPIEQFVTQLWKMHDSWCIWTSKIWSEY